MLWCCISSYDLFLTNISTLDFNKTLISRRLKQFATNSFHVFGFEPLMIGLKRFCLVLYLSLPYVRMFGNSFKLRKLREYFSKFKTNRKLNTISGPCSVCMYLKKPIN